VCLGDRQLADSEEMFDVCDKKCFGPTSLREPLRNLKRCIKKLKNIYMKRCERAFHYLSALHFS